MSIHEILPDLFQVEIPVPGTLKILNAYACRGKDGWSLVDCGLGDEAAHAAWERAFASLGITPVAVERILVTHLHPDHIGAAGWLQERTGAPVYMHDREIEYTDRLWGRQHCRAQAEETGELFVRHGAPAHLVRAMVDFQIHVPVHPLPVELVPLQAGAAVRLGNREWQVIWTPGHTDGLAIFWCEDEGLLLVNDMVLNQISPNIQLVPNFHPDPLGLFLDSLDRVARLPARLALPGHRSLIRDLAPRCRELAAHHRERLDAVLALARKGATAWEVCQGLFTTRLTDLFNIRFAISETLSHLVYLHQRDRLTREETGTGYRFRVS